MNYAEARNESAGLINAPMHQGKRSSLNIFTVEYIAVTDKNYFITQNFFGDFTPS